MFVCFFGSNSCRTGRVYKVVGSIPSFVQTGIKLFSFFFSFLFSYLGHIPVVLVECTRLWVRFPVLFRQGSNWVVCLFICFIFCIWLIFLLYSDSKHASVSWIPTLCHTILLTLELFSPFNFKHFACTDNLIRPQLTVAKFSICQCPEFPRTQFSSYSMWSFFRQNEKELASLAIFLETISGSVACVKFFYERRFGQCYRIWHKILGIHD